MKKITAHIVFWVLLLLLAGCGGARNLVVLVPDPDGSVGRVNVFNESGSVVMDSPNQATTIKDCNSTPAAPKVMQKEEIESIFSKALAIQPAPPVHFIFYFERDAVEIVPDSRHVLTELIESARRQNALSFSVVGHSDTAGNKDYNLGLSKRRAQAITRLLVENGISRDIIETTSHGEENPLIKTEDNVNEPRNRRVEVTVR